MNLYFILTLGIVLYSIFIIKKNKIIDIILYYALLVWMWILMAFNCGGVDYETYELLFKTSEKININELYKGEYLFKNAMYFFKNLKLEFFELSFLIQTIGIILFNKLIKKYSIKGSRSFVIASIYIYPLVDNIIQKRNFISMMLVVLAITFLIEKDRLKVYKYIVLILLAFTLHTSSIIYLGYLILVIIDLKKIKSLSVILMSFLIVILPLIPKFVEKLFPFYATKIYLYFYNLENRLSLEKAFIFIIIHLILFFIIILTFKIFNDKLKNSFNILVLKLNYISLVFIPFYFYNLIFFRYYRNISLINYIFLANIFYKNYKNKNIRIIRIVFIIYLISMFIIFYAFFGKYKYEGLVEPLFIENNFLKFFNSK